MDKYIIVMEILGNFKKAYSEEIVRPLSKNDYKKINDILKVNGYSLGRLSGNIGRTLVDSIIDTIESEVNE